MIAEYAPNLVKKTIVGAGHGDKSQNTHDARRAAPAGRSGFARRRRRARDRHHACASPAKCSAPGGGAMSQISCKRRCSPAPLPLVGRGRGWGAANGAPHVPHLPDPYPRPLPHKGEGRRKGACDDRRAYRHDRQLRRGFRDPQRQRRRLSGALLGPYPAGAAIGRRSGRACDRDPCARGPDPPVRIPVRQRARVVPVAADQGVGTKVALAILSTLKPADLATAIAMRDKATITCAPGVGQKVAERIVTPTQGQSAGAGGGRSRHGAAVRRDR